MTYLRIGVLLNIGLVFSVAFVENVGSENFHSRISKRLGR